ncbi:MAG: HEPN domain-containing protein [Nitrospirae bacterium]|nr:MAG: HEPN domain-containing protein [Nitrospirota bacterium]
MNINECFEKRLLKKGRPDMLKSKKALEISVKTLVKAKRLLKHGFHSEAIITAYTAMFQSARALLFKDGIFERSHFCVIEYLKEHYAKKHLLSQDYLHSIDTYRIQRHEALYGLEEISYEKTEVEDAIEKAEKFIKVISKIVSDK